MYRYIPKVGGIGLSGCIESKVDFCILAGCDYLTTIGKAKGLRV